MNSKFILIIGFLTLTNVKLSSSADDDLADFDFDTLDTHSNADDYYYNDEVLVPHGIVEKSDDLFNGDDLTGVSGTSFENKEQKIKSTLLKAWTNGELKRKFAEVLPILKVMSSSQKLALAALISAQVSATDGKSLNINQVKTMFGDRPELLLPLTLDIANLVKLAGIKSETSATENEPTPNVQLLRRSFQEQEKKISSSNYMKDDRLHLNDDTEPRIIKQRDVFVPVVEPQEPKADEKKSRNARSVMFEMLPTPLPVHKKMSNERSYHERKLNMTNFNGTGDQMAIDTSETFQFHVLPDETDQRYLNDDLDSYYKTQNLTLEEIEKLAFGNLNGTDYDTDYMDDSDLVSQISKTKNDLVSQTSKNESLPTPEMLISVRYRPKLKQVGPYRRRVPPATPGHGMVNCERFANVCIRTPEYPMDLIMGSIHRNRHAMKALLAEYRDNFIENNIDADIMYIRRRGDEIQTPGGMCPSIVRYARPQKARSANGEWKYIVNTGQHTQTLRLEKCSTPQESCTYLTDSFRSRCTQIFNYHRLLSWDKVRGLHVDIFKVPTCCSCHIDGYRETFPPFNDDYKSSSISKSTKYPSVSYGSVATNDDEDDDEDDDLNGNSYFSSGIKLHKAKPFNLDTSYLSHSASTQNNRYDRPKNSHIDDDEDYDEPFRPSAPEIGTYLSPPSNDGGGYKPKGNNFLKRIPVGQTQIVKRKRRPIRRDQSISESEVKPTKIRVENIDITTSRPIKKIPTTRRVYSKIVKREKVNAKLPNISTASPSAVPISTTTTTTATTATSTVTASATSPAPSSKTTVTTINTDPSKRINYNYHPIIDFFEEEQETDDDVRYLSEREIGDRMGTGIRLGGGEQSWRPIPTYKVDRRRLSGI